MIQNNSFVFVYIRSHCFIANLYLTVAWLDQPCHLSPYYGRQSDNKRLFEAGHLCKRSGVPPVTAARFYLLTIDHYNRTKMIVYYKRIGTAGSATVRPQRLGTVAGNLKTIKPIIIFISAGNFPVTAFVVFDFLCLY